jgi:3-phosphoshikimate 1-carboxyvinyltransferase
MEGIMEIIVNQSSLKGEITIPGSKSHVIRALVIATLAKGQSKIYSPLSSGDTLSCLQGCQAFGAKFNENEDYWQIEGVGGKPVLPQDIVDVGNSGTSINFLTGLASLIDGYTILTGDSQIKRRPSEPLLAALRMLGVEAHSAPRTKCPPLVVKGPIKGGYAEVKDKVSQYLSSLLVTCPLSAGDTEIKAIDLAEKPYVEMTLSWLDKQHIEYQKSDDLEHFWIKGGQSYQAFSEAIPADFSSATFFICTAAIPGCEILLKGLDFNDTQGDKAVVDLLRQMGADIQQTNEGLHIRGKQLTGIELDIADMPDSLPALAVVGCLAQGETKIRNVAHARLKETDRISIMRHELTKMGANIEELDDGLIIRESRLIGTTVSSHHDHRVAMALAIAGLVAEETTTILDADAVNVTFPQFPTLLQKLNGDCRF